MIFKAAVNVTCLSLSRSAASRPIASFLSLGPSGARKTLISKAVILLVVFVLYTVLMFVFPALNTPLRLFHCCIDGSEHSEERYTVCLIGAPPAYVSREQRGQRMEYISCKPYLIVLVDEIEKALREPYQLFLQVLDHGRLTDGQDRIVDFRNTVIIHTSDLAAAFLIGMVKPKRR